MYIQFEVYVQSQREREREGGCQKVIQSAVLHVHVCPSRGASVLMLYAMEADHVPSSGHCRYYDDFHTIDWVRDRNRDRLRHQRLNKNRKLSWKGWAKKFWDAGSGWLIVFLVGVSSGILAGIYQCGYWGCLHVSEYEWILGISMYVSRQQSVLCCSPIYGKAWYASDVR